MMNQNAAEIKSMESVKSILAEHKEQIAKFLENNPSEGLWAAACLFFASQNKLKLVPSDMDYKGYNVIARDEEVQIDVMVTDPIVSAEDFKNYYFCYHSGRLKDDNSYRVIAKTALQTLCSKDRENEYTQVIRVGHDYYEYAKFLMEKHSAICDCSFERDAIYIIMFESLMDYLNEKNLVTDKTNEPYEVSNMAVKILNLPTIQDNSEFYNIYNPNAGIGSYYNAFLSNYKFETIHTLYEFQESDTEKYLFCVLNLYMHVQNFFADGYISDFSDNAGYEYALSTPRRGVMVWDKESKREYPEADLYLDKSAQDCDKKAIGVYHFDICFRENKHLAETRKRIVSEDSLESVILLPSDLFNDTSAQTVIIVVNKQKQNKGFVRFVDASGCCEAKYNRNVLNVEDALSLYNSVDNNAKVKDIPNQDIADHGYILYPNLYINGITDIPEDMEEVTLGELLEVADTEDTYADTYDYVYSESYVQNRLGRIISASSLPEAKEKLSLSDAHSNWHQCTQDSIVFSGSSFRYLKDNYESYPRTLIPYSYNAFKVVSDKVKPEYLVYQLASPFFKSQLEKFEKEREKCKLSRREIIVAQKKGINIRKDFLTGILNCKVRIHKSLDQQMVIAEAEAAKEQKELNRKRKAREASSHENYVLNMRQRKHAVAQVLNEILPAVENIQSFIFNRGTIDKDSVVSRRNGTTLGQYVTSVKNQLEKVSMMVDSFTNIDAYGVPERVELGQFLKEYCDSKINEVYRPVFVNKDNREWIVDICPKDLTQALDNLFTNAVKHGFKDFSRKNYQIRVEVSNFKLESGKVAIFVANNGEPASKSVSLDRMFVWGVGQGTGIGCSQVKEIIEYFDGEVSYAEYPDSEDGFESVFKIVLPLIID